MDLVKHDFYLIDPKTEITTNSSYQAWVTYYNHRSDKCIEKWFKPKIKHQMQTDNIHCGDFVIHFIEQFVTKKHLRETIDDFLAFRTKIDNILEKFSIKE